MILKHDGVLFENDSPKTERALQKEAQKIVERICKRYSVYDFKVSKVDVTNRDGHITYRFTITDYYLTLHIEPSQNLLRQRAYVTINPNATRASIVNGDFSGAYELSGFIDASVRGFAELYAELEEALSFDYNV